MEFNHLLIKAEHEVWPPERALIDHGSSPTSQSSPVRVHVDFICHRTHRWINRPSDGGHSQLVRERRYQTVRISACIDAHKFKSYPESHPIIARMLTDLRIVSDFHDPIINDVFQSGRRVLNWFPTWVVGQLYPCGSRACHARMCFMKIALLLGLRRVIACPICRFEMLTSA
ncbi:hypothetical protein Acr_13g0015300 [Actinidia rufa]|uniref:Uncharacterized protein n=1 Tax=Actinidia rufa TaxID=165716 RepID=A0A7J0FNA4_9ERIC|nr:hypothetical protein Acr_13g0015300 [Actinidia rufa]